MQAFSQSESVSGVGMLGVVVDDASGDWLNFWYNTFTVSLNGVVNDSQTFTQSQIANNIISY